MWDWQGLSASFMQAFPVFSLPPNLFCYILPEKFFFA
jgi:hypothetical protein